MNVENNNKCANATKKNSKFILFLKLIIFNKKKLFSKEFFYIINK